MRRKIRCDCTAEPPGELITSATAAALRMAKARSSGAGEAGDGQARPQRRRKADDAGQAHHRHDRRRRRASGAAASGAAGPDRAGTAAAGVRSSSCRPWFPHKAPRGCAQVTHCSSSRCINALGTNLAGGIKAHGLNRTKGDDMAIKVLLLMTLVGAIAAGSLFGEPTARSEVKLRTSARRTALRIGGAAVFMTTNGHQVAAGSSTPASLDRNRPSA